MMSQALSRRESLRLAAAGVSAVSLSQWLPNLALHAAEAPKRKHKSCILLWMDGGPSQTDTFDPKPNAPAEFRGPFKTISTSVPGLQIGEGYTKLAQHMKHACVIRGMSTTEAAEHWRGRIYMHTGYRPNFAGLSYPTMGSIVSHHRSTDSGLPNFVVTGKTMLSFPHINGAGFLHPRHTGLLVRDPSKGVDNATSPHADAELTDRLALVDQLAANFQRTAPWQSVAAQRAAYNGAVELVRSSKSQVFDLSKESAATHDRYGKHEFGQGCLMARRLVEAGVPFVEVYLSDWDTHDQKRGESVRDVLLPVSDQAMTALITDLKDRGLLDDTLIVWMGEFGRTPKTHGNPSLRNHYDKAWSTVLFGGGAPGGAIIGKTDDKAAEVIEHPVSGPDFIATVLTLLGIDPTKDLHAGSRPVRITATGANPIAKVVGRG
ncbi:MAG: DUF1501 domain-containing protein [Planctomycetes bacterium]|nr:DUF1501 domain-containing protein [Planctomycetota bacterium]